LDGANYSYPTQYLRNPMVGWSPVRLAVAKPIVNVPSYPSWTPVFFER
jgi:hypothetical protein